MGRLDDKIAIVTGAASGIGAATARRVAAEGAHTVVADLNLDGAKAVTEEIRAARQFRHGGPGRPGRHRLRTGHGGHGS